MPNISVGPEGVEVVEGPNAVSHIDRLIAALANRQGPGGVVDAGNAERNEHNNILNINVNPVVVIDNNIRGGNVGGAYQANVAPAAAAAAAANNRLNNANNNLNNVNGNNGNNNNTIRVRVGVVRRAGEVHGVRQSSGNWQRGTHQFKWLRRMYVRPMSYARLKNLRRSV